MTDPTPVAVASRSFSRHPVLRAELLARYPNATFNEGEATLAGAALIAHLKGHAKAITGLERLDARVFDAVPELRVVSKYGVGVDMIDTDAMRARGIRLGWTGGTNRRAVTELVIALAISLLRFVPETSRAVAAGGWPRPIGRQLSERTVGIVGCGHVGKDLAVLLRAFGCRVLANDILDFPGFYAAHGVEPVALEALLRESDIVTLHVPLDASTRGMIGAPELAMMKPRSLLINAARGGIVDEGALKTALIDGPLAGAALDVFASEPTADRELLALPNLLATPHIGGNAEEAVLAMGRAAIRGLDDNAVPAAGAWPMRA